MDKNEEKFYKNLGKRIVYLRLKAGYKNQESFAYDAGIARGQYTRYELGTNMKINNLYKIIKAHKMSWNDFFSEGF
jgi:transcriptional regulator with XRE-family HTH domain